MDLKKMGQLERKVIEKYLGRKNYVVRIEKDKKWEIKVYYDGIQSFSVKNGKINLNVAMFTLKGQKENFDELKEDEKKLLDKIYAQFKIGFKSRKTKIKTCYKDKYDFYFKVEHSSNEENYNSKAAKEKYIKIKEVIQKEFASSMEIEIRGCIDYLFFNGSEINYDKLIKITKVGIENTTGRNGKDAGIKKIAMNEQIVLSEPIDFDIINKIMEKRIAKYNGADTAEKRYQQKLMNMMYEQIEKKKENKNLNLFEKGPFNKNTYPFLMEYNFYEAPIQKKKRYHKKGRIDNVFIKDNKVLFVELKMDTKAINNTNGIHKHLIDVLNGIRKNKEFIDELNVAIDEYNESVNDTSKKGKYKIANITNKNEIEFAIICGYTKGKKDIVEAEIDKYYYQPAKQAKVEEKDKEYNSIYLNKSIDQLRKELENEKEIKCRTFIYLADENYNNFDLYIPKNERE